MKRAFVAVVAILGLFFPIYQPVSAAQFFTISGRVTQADGSPVKALRAWVSSMGAQSDIDADGYYSFLVPESTNNNELTIIVTNYPSGVRSNYLIENAPSKANFTSWIKPDKNLEVNFKLPEIVPITILIADGKGQPISTSALGMNSVGGYFKAANGVEWLGISWPTGDEIISISGGQYNFWVYSLPHYLGGTYSYAYLQNGSRNMNSRVPRIPMDKPGVYKMCAPLNLNESKTTPSDCYDEAKSAANMTTTDLNKLAAELKAKQEAEAKAAAELKAKQEAEAKAAAELKAKQEAEAKAAAELKARQEADAKAAAELKAKQDAEAKAAADKVALNKAQTELTEARTALSDSQKVNREQAARIASFEEQFKVLSESVNALQSQVSQLNTKLAAALSGLNSANAKIKKICAAKPKPKGC